MNDNGRMWDEYDRALNTIKAQADEIETLKATIADLDRITNDNPAMTSVLLERKRQDEKWGEQNHDPITWLAILGEEYGELAQAVLETKFGGEHGGLPHMREEAVHTAAVALAFLECLDRARERGDRLAVG